MDNPEKPAVFKAKHAVTGKAGNGITANDRGVVLVTAVLVLAVLMILGTTAFLQTNTDVRIEMNFLAEQKAFYAAEAGIEEARARLCLAASNAIVDEDPTNPDWMACVGTKSEATGGKRAVPNCLSWTPSVQTALDYTVTIEHGNDGSGRVLYWGDSDGNGTNEKNAAGRGETIYLVTSFGRCGTALKIIRAEMARVPPITAVSALYVKAPTTVQGPGVHILGADGCGKSDLPGISTAGPPGSVTESGSPTITGSTRVQYDGPNRDIRAMIDALKGHADFLYETPSATQGGSDRPGPGDGWGSPAAGASFRGPSVCSDSNIVHYDTGGTFIRFSDGVTGCGILLVDGDLEITGDFSWHGAVLVSGSVRFTGPGNRNVTGTLMAGGSAGSSLIGGDTTIVRCGTAVDGQTLKRPLLILSWRETA